MTFDELVEANKDLKLCPRCRRLYDAQDFMAFIQAFSTCLEDRFEWQRFRGNVRRALGAKE